MWPSTRATRSEATTSFDWVILRELATTLKPRSTNAFTTPAPIPYEAPVTMAVLRGPLMVVHLTEARCCYSSLLSAECSIAGRIHEVVIDMIHQRSVLLRFRLHLL